MQFGVSFQPLSGKILVGRLDRSGKAFKDKVDGSPMALRAVAEYLISEYEGEARITFPDGRVFEMSAFEISNESAGGGDTPDDERNT